MIRIIKLLSDGQFHSGETLGQELNLTRSAIWKLVKQLSLWDISVETRSGKGYRIQDGLNLLDLPSIKSHIESENLKKLSDIEIFLELPSTNDYLLNGPFQSSNGSVQPSNGSVQLSNGPFQHRVCLAERQTKGRGRSKRTWFSPFAKNIALSILWYFPKDVSELSGLSLAIGVATLKTLHRLGIIENLMLKWPNDILWKNQKIGGILIELTGETHHISRTVIGVGLNIDVPKHYDDKIDQPWINLESIIEHKLDRNLLTGLLLNELLNALQLFQEQGLTPFLEFWKKHDLTYGKTISIITPSGLLQGKSLGVNDKGHLLLQTKDQEIKAFSSGEVSLRLNETEPA